MEKNLVFKAPVLKCLKIFWRIFASSPAVIKDFQNALRRDKNGALLPISYVKLMPEFKPGDLVNLVLAYGVILLTLESEAPSERACLAFVNVVLWRPYILR